MKPYAQPLFYWLAALSGLVLSLLTDGAGDVIALVLAALPLVGIARHLAASRAR